MNRIGAALVCAAMLFAVRPGFASDDVESELAQMREIVQGLQQKIDANEEQLGHRQGLIEEARDIVRTHDEGTHSGVSNFLDSINVGGHVAGSWFWNFDDPSGRLGGAGLNQGDIGVMPFHPDHNSFSVDQIWLSISKEATEESRGGFAFDIFYGNNANALGQGTGFENSHSRSNGRLSSINHQNGGFDEDDEPLSRRYSAFDSTSDYYIAQAYVEYQCGCLGPEVNWKFGKWQTLVGAEVVQAGHNMNITVGNVYALIQPVDHLGLLATTDLGPVELSLGIMNSGGSQISSPDTNKEKSYLASLKVGDDMMNARASFIYGADPLYFDEAEDFDGIEANGLRTGLVDVVGWFHPSDNVSTWANFTYMYGEGSDFSALGVAVAGRVQLTEKVGAALRGEYLTIDDPVDSGTESGDPGQVCCIDGEDLDNLFAEGDLYSLTSTLDYKLTDHLTARAEFRFDWFNEKGNSGFGFFENSDGNADNQSVAGLEVIYTF